MYASDTASDDVERTAFRKAEKKYKLYYDNSKKKKQPKPVDLSEVIDFRAVSESYSRNDELPAGVFAVQSGLDKPVFCLESHPGFYFIPGALSVDEQCKWTKESLTNFPQPPNRTNHNAIYGPITDLFTASTEGKFLIEVESPRETNGSHEQHLINGQTWKISSDSGTGKSVSASVLLRKLRWSTLGLQFDWSKRSYNVSLPHNKIPDSLSDLAKKLAGPAMSFGEEFQPEAAIVNYFGSGDMLGGHLDDMEKDWSKPIVSMSLGCKAIFLLGGKTREEQPVGMFLRSGDVVLMAGEARECFHGVPRIFTDKEHAELDVLESQFSQKDELILEYIRTSRININIRQVY